MKAFNLLALAFILATNFLNTQIVPGQDPITELAVVTVNLCYFFRKELSAMKRFLIALCLLLLALCLAPACQAGGAVIVRGGLFRPRVVVSGGGFHNNAVVVNRGFNNRVVVANGFGFAQPRVVVNGFGGHGFVGQSVFAPRAVVVSPFGGGCVNGQCVGASGLFLGY